MADTDDLGWARYNAAVMAQTCSRCGSGPRKRCMGPRGWVVAHKARIEAAGYRWSTVLGRLETK